MPDEFEVLPSGEALRLLESELLTEILDGMERDALDQCVNAAPSDDETRRTGTTLVRAIRDLRTQLESRARGKAKQKQTTRKA